MKRLVLYLFAFLLTVISSSAQENYEIQVYGSATQPVKQTIFEIHSNYTAQGEKLMVDGVYPSHRAWHKTIEITHGIAKNFETGIYFFTNYTPGQGWKLIGFHLRPRWAAPQHWNLPVGVSLSAEIGWQQAKYAAETFSLELRPIFDKTIGKLYVSFNPTLGFGFKGVGASSSPAIAPSFKLAYSASKKVSLGTEYYSELGSFKKIAPLAQEQHALFVVADLYVDPKWEINFGAGKGLTQATDGLVLKVLLGRRIQWK